MLACSWAPALLAMAVLVKAVSFSDLTRCEQDCINNMDTATGCVPVTSECLCSHPNFFYGIEDCAKAACGAADATAALDYAKSSCATVLSTSAAAIAPSTDPATPVLTAFTETTTPVVAASLKSATSASQTPQPSLTAAAARPDSATASSTSTAGADTTGNGSSSTSSSDSKTTGASTTSTSGSSSDDSATGGGLSSGAKAGMAVGAIVVAVGLVGAIMFLSRKRKPLPRGTYKISPPMPGAGRVATYAEDDFERFNQVAPPRNMYSAGSNMSELDRSARPYEEMVPRTTPARMV